MTPTLTILIPTLERRKHFFLPLMQEFTRQIVECNTADVTILFDRQEGMSIGVKRNNLMARVNTDYVCFFDDDDKPADNYVRLILDAIATEPDCCSLRGEYYCDGDFQAHFEHSMKQNN